MVAIGWLDSQDQTTAHDAVQWLKAVLGVGNVQNANNTTPWVVGYGGIPVSLPFFPFGGYTAELGFLEIDTTGVTALGDGQLTLTVNQIPTSVFTDSELVVAPYDWGGAPIAFGQWRTVADLQALSPAGSVLWQTIQDAGIGGEVIFPIASSAINRGGLTRLVFYHGWQRDGTIPPDLESSVEFDTPLDTDLVILTVTPFKNPGVMTASSVTIQSTFPIQTNFGTMTLNEVIALPNPIAVSTLNAIGVNTTINIPTGTTAITIVPPATNPNALTLKGVAGDTGILISKTQPTQFTVDPTQASFVLDAAVATTVQLTFM